MHSFLKIDEVYAVRRNPLIAATLQIEKLAREAGITEDLAFELLRETEDVDD